jgi:hypothetical protein
MDKRPNGRLSVSLCRPPPEETDDAAKAPTSNIHPYHRAFKKETNMHTTQRTTLTKAGAAGMVGLGP